MSVQASASPSPQVTPTKASLQQQKSAKANHRSTSNLPGSPGNLPTPTQTAFEHFTAYPFEDSSTIAPSALLPPAMPNIDLHPPKQQQQPQQVHQNKQSFQPSSSLQEAAPFATSDFQTSTAAAAPSRSSAAPASASGTPSLPMIAFDPQHPPSDDEGSGSDGEGGAGNGTPARPRKRKSTVDLRAASRQQSVSGPSTGEPGTGDAPESARRKITIEYIEDKSKRHITFSKRKAGIMKKAYELSTLTGTQVLLLVVSESGWVYTFTTDKFKPLVKEDEHGQLSEGQRLIAACLQDPPAPPATQQQASVYKGGASDQFDSSQAEILARRRPIATNRRVSSKGRPAAIRTDGEVPPVPPLPAGMVSYLDQPALTPTSPTRIPVTPTRGSSMQQAQQQMLAMGGPRSGPVDYPPDMHYGGYEPGHMYTDVYANMPGSAPATYHYTMHDYGNVGYPGDPSQQPSPHYTTQPDPHMMMSHLNLHGGHQQVGAGGRAVHAHHGSYHEEWVPRDHR